MRYSLHLQQHSEVPIQNVTKMSAVSSTALIGTKASTGTSQNTAYQVFILRTYMTIYVPVQLRSAIRDANLALRLNALLCSPAVFLKETFPIYLGSFEPVHFSNVALLIFRAFITHLIS